MVVAIIGILAAVGVVAYNGYTASSKANATKTNYKNISKWIQTEMVKCNAGLSDKIFTANPQNCPITAAQTFASGMNSACRSPNGVFYDIKNPYKTNDRICRFDIICQHSHSNKWSCNYEPKRSFAKTVCLFHLNP